MAGYNTGRSATLKLLKKDPITQRVGLSTFKLWIKQRKELASMPETRGRKVNKDDMEEEQEEKKEASRKRKKR